MAIEVLVTIDEAVVYGLGVGLSPVHFAPILAEHKLPPDWARESASRIREFADRIAQIIVSMRQLARSGPREGELVTPPWGLFGMFRSRPDRREHWSPTC
jgi:hypothetical protein